MIKPVITAIALGLAALAPTSLRAETFPTQPIRIVVPYPPGGSTDVMARLIQDPLAKALGQPVIVENRAGAGGAIGAREVAKADPDGYTLLFTNVGGGVIAPLLQEHAGYDLIKKFTPISVVATQGVLLIANPSVPANNLKELVAFAKTQETPLLYASAGSGTLGHLSSELLAHTAGIEVTHVPYKGTGPALLSVVSGETQIMFSTMPPGVLEYIRTGKLKVLGTSVPMDGLPAGTPVLSDEFPDLKQGAWFGILGPAGLPDTVRQTLNKAVTEAIADPNVESRFRAAEFTPTPTTSAEFAQIITSGTTLWGRAIKEYGIKPE